MCRFVVYVTLIFLGSCPCFALMLPCVLGQLIYVLNSFHPFVPGQVFYKLYLFHPYALLCVYYVNDFFVSFAPVSVFNVKHKFNSYFQKNLFIFWIFLFLHGVFYSHILVFYC